jgi:hypothetical protein
MKCFYGSSFAVVNYKFYLFLLLIHSRPLSFMYLLSAQGCGCPVLGWWFVEGLTFGQDFIEYYWRWLRWNCLAIALQRIQWLGDDVVHRFHLSDLRVIFSRFSLRYRHASSFFAIYWKEGTRTETVEPRPIYLLWSLGWVTWATWPLITKCVGLTLTTLFESFMVLLTSTARFISSQKDACQYCLEDPTIDKPYKDISAQIRLHITSKFNSKRVHYPRVNAALEKNASGRGHLTMESLAWKPLTGRSKTLRIVSALNG